MKDTYHMTTHSPQETKQLAERLGSRLTGGEVLVLRGGIGVGKTTFTQGIARGLGITETVNSPTFTIIKEYQGRLPLFHVDAYRLEDADEELGLEEYFEGEGVTVVEWAEHILSDLPDQRLEIQIEPTGEEKRQIVIKAYGMRYEHLLKEVLE